MSKIAWIVFLLGIMMINPAFVTEWLNALLSSPIVFLAGFTLGLVIGVAWNNKEAKGLKAERDAVKAEKEAVKAEKASLERDLKRYEKDFEALKTKMAPYTKPMYEDDEDD